ncbi:hypothetical protein H4Q26_004370 [Puccinia striiformis f. sp. tritici PST-130]|nr:hypothetical protein H4Q26_004370 [Puccinia striiformis f. sp. tritici PST-130]
MQSLMRRATTPLGIRRKPRAAPTPAWQQDQTACPREDSHQQPHSHQNHQPNQSLTSRISHRHEDLNKEKDHS